MLDQPFTVNKQKLGDGEVGQPIFQESVVDAYSNGAPGRVDAIGAKKNTY
jgi:hypothetical protein